MANLEKSLSEAFVIDAKRKAEDEMKKRAIVTARTYDEFRHLVAAAQQKPLDPRDIARKAEVSANRALGGGATRREAAVGFDLSLPGLCGMASHQGGQGGGTAAGPSLGTGGPAGALPSTAAEFDRAWRRLPKDDSTRVSFLCTLGPERLTDLFRVDIDGELLGALLKTMAVAGLQPSTAGTDDAGSGSTAPTPALCASLALALSASEGFSLALDLLSPVEVGHAKVIAQAAAAAGAQEVADKVRSAYHV